jgi:serine/threonine-protein kinase RsbW
MLEAWMRILGYANKDIFAVRLAFNEAVINAFRHGNRSDPGKRIHVRYLVTAAEILLQVEDQGPGFDPNQVPDPLSEPFLDRPCGRGLFLMRSYMTWVSFNREGNRVTLCRQRSLS